MSVLIKGMEMPYSCNECDIAYYDNTFETLRCPFLFDSMSIYYRERNPSCPLVDVPTSHGWLIDADNIYTSHDGYLEFTEIEAPTIIEAEDMT